MTRKLYNIEIYCPIWHWCSQFVTKTYTGCPATMSTPLIGRWLRNLFFRALKLTWVCCFYFICLFWGFGNSIYLLFSHLN